MKEIDLNQNFLGFLSAIVDLTKTPFCFLTNCFNGDSTLEKFLMTEGYDMLRFRDIGEKRYIAICDVFKKQGFSFKDYPVFSFYKSAKKHINRKKTNLQGYLRPRRISLLHNLVDNLEKKAPGFVLYENEFLELLQDLKKLIAKK